VKTGWQAAWRTMVTELAPQDRSGSYVRQSYSITSEVVDLKAEAGRYHLYLGNACPWCHRAGLALALRGLGPPLVTFTRLGSDPTKARRGGWIFTRQDPDPVFGAADLWEVYDRLQPGWRGRCTAPLLVDRITRKALSNESSNIVVLLGALQLPGGNRVELRPGQLVKQIDELSDKIYSAINNGVYRAGFSTSQEAYDRVMSEMLSCLDDLEDRLSRSRFLLGDKFTEADLRLYPTIVRFDAVYAGIFRCGRRTIRGDYPNLQAWMRDVYQIKMPGGGLQVSDTIDVDAARHSYYTSLFPLNPSGIVPAGPTAADLGLGLPHGRGGSGAGTQDIFYLKGSS